MAVAGHVGVAPSANKREVVQISSYSRRLKDNIKSLLDNYGEILRAAKVSGSSGPSGEYDANAYHVESEIQIRASNMVRAAEALSKLVAELKEYLILNDFSSINETITQRSSELAKGRLTILEELKRLYDLNQQNQQQLLEAEQV